jgi:hypothetical protein
LSCALTVLASIAAAMAMSPSVDFDFQAIMKAHRLMMLL